MKKNKILILLVSLFSIFIISDRVDALSYTASDGLNYNVTDSESLRDWCYFTRYKTSNYQNMATFYSYNRNRSYVCVLSNSDFKLDSSNYFSIVNYSSKLFYCLITTSYGVLNNNSTASCYSDVSSTSAFITSNLFNSSPIFKDDNSIYADSNFIFKQIEDKYSSSVVYDIKYYLNNELYDTITVEGGSSHTLKDNPSYNSSTQYWSGWTYDNNIDLSNITSDVNIYGTITDKSNYIITYYLNDEVYRTDSVIEGNSYILLDYVPPKNYNFSGWTYDSNYNFNDVRENMNIYGTSVFVRPGMHYSEDIDSPIHNLSVSILGREIPVEFDFLYTIMDFIILMLLVICVIAPFIIVFKLLGGGF